MLTEYLKTTDPAVEADWQSVMPGVQVCRFKMNQPEENGSVILAPVLEQMHFEAIYCRSGAMVLGRKRGGPLTLCRQEVLLLSDSSSLTSVRVSTPFDGVLVAVDGVNAGESLNMMCRMLGNLQVYTSQVRQWMDDRDGCALLRAAPWTRAVFAVLDTLPMEEQGRYCLLKTVELLYLLCTRSTLLEDGTEAVCLDSYLSRIVAEIHTYMENHLEEKLTIEAMSHKFHISPTAFKSCFRRLYGQPVHRWLQSLRLRRAAELLYASPMSILQIAQAVGYEGVSQFNVAFKNRFGVTPRQYRKMSESGDF